MAKADGHNTRPTWVVSMLAGASAGLMVDAILYPLDTIKTRAQSKRGFKKTGGFKGIYLGIMPVLLGSAPASALFFVTYNSTVSTLSVYRQSWPDPVIHVLSATWAEVVGSVIRVPLEMVKQRKQTSSKYTSSLDIVKLTISREGLGGFYRGFFSTLSREIPFVALQFPIWEMLKKQYEGKDHEHKITPFETACCGAVAGGCAAAVTTPLDVIRTRIMLGEKNEYGKAGTQGWKVITEIIAKGGFLGLFAGIVPRVLWITFGGFIYFGVYEQMKTFCQLHNEPITPNEIVFRQAQVMSGEEENDDEEDPRTK